MEAGVIFRLGSGNEVRRRLCAEDKCWGTYREGRGHDEQVPGEVCGDGGTAREEEGVQFGLAVNVLCGGGQWGGDNIAKTRI